MFSPFNAEATGLNLPTIKKIQDCIASFSDIKTAVLYGSRAMGTYKNGSDIDLCFLGDSLQQETISKLSFALDDLLLPYSFDLCVYNSIENPNLKDHIDRVGMEFFKSLP